jgi:hypothetical protein
MRFFLFVLLLGILTPSITFSQVAPNPFPKKDEKRAPPQKSPGRVDANRAEIPQPAPVPSAPTNVSPGKIEAKKDEKKPAPAPQKSPGRVDANRAEIPQPAPVPSAPTNVSPGKIEAKKDEKKPAPQKSPGRVDAKKAEIPQPAPVPSAPTYVEPGKKASKDVKKFEMYDERKNLMSLTSIIYTTCGIILLISFLLMSEMIRDIFRDKELSI